MYAAQILALSLLLAPAATAAVTSAPDAPGIALGQPAQMADVAMKSVGGKDVTIATAAGKKGTLVVFMCNHCPWVKAWQTRIASIGNSAVKSGIGVVAINSNDPSAFPDDDFATMVTRSRDLGFKFPYAVDATSDIARSFGATRTPEAFLFDSDGKLVYHGTVDDNAHDQKAVKKQWLLEAVRAVAAGKPVAEAQTKALGCGIKYREKSAS